MITCFNVNRIVDLQFNNYLLLPQYSHSYLKNERQGFSQNPTITVKMRLGSLVDGLLTGSEVDMADKLYPIAKNIAAKLSAEFGWAIKRLYKQVSYTGIMRYDAGRSIIFDLPVKTRPDFEEPKTFIIDLKVTDETDVDKAINFLGYKNQMFGYGKMAGCPVAYLLMYRRKMRDTVIRKITIGDHNEFWKEKIIKFGKAA
jgi:hypothetical protein